MRAGHHPYWMRPSLHQQSVFVVRLRAFTLLSETIIWLRNDSYPLGNKYILYSSHVAYGVTRSPHVTKAVFACRFSLIPLMNLLR